MTGKRIRCRDGRCHHVLPREATFYRQRSRALIDSVSTKALTCGNRVELWGFEPQTPSMRTRCATRLRHSPWNR